MNTTVLDHSSSQPAISRPAHVRQAEITRGAVQHGIAGQRVFVGTEILEEYQEIDPTLGLNVCGVVLSVLSRHLVTLPAVELKDTISVCLRRRDDGRAVDVFLSVSRSRRRGEECLILHWLEDRDRE